METKVGTNFTASLRIRRRGFLWGLLIGTLGLAKTNPVLSMALAHSYSGIKDYEGCPRRYHEVKILKKFKSKDTEATMYGTAVHKAFEDYILHARRFSRRERAALKALLPSTSVDPAVLEAAGLKGREAQEFLAKLDELAEL